MARFSVLLALAVLIAAPAAVRADDGAMVGAGGAIAPMKEHPSIRMAWERVSVDFTPGESTVDCLFCFHNEGPATTVRMGFPESSSGDGQDPHHPHGFTHFASLVDGKPVPTRIEGLKGGAQLWERWRTKTVRFGAGQTRLVQERYTSPGGRVSDGSCSFTYRLDTGGSWKGPIGQVDVVVHLRQAPPGYRISAWPVGFRKNGSTLSWRWTDLKPAASPLPIQNRPPQPVSGIEIRLSPDSMHPASPQKSLPRPAAPA